MSVPSIRYLLCYHATDNFPIGVVVFTITFNFYDYSDNKRVIVNLRNDKTLILSGHKDYVTKKLSMVVEKCSNSLGCMIPKISGPEQFFGPHIFLVSTGLCHYGFRLLRFESGKRWFPLSPY